jgi:hypothetical protein
MPYPFFRVSPENQRNGRQIHELRFVLPYAAAMAEIVDQILGSNPNPHKITAREVEKSSKRYIPI